MNFRTPASLAFLTVTCASILLAAGANHAGGKHRVVFQVTAEGDQHWDALVHNVENLRTTFGPQDTADVYTHLWRMIAPSRKEGEL